MLTAAARTINIDLDVILLLVSICVISAVGILLIVLLVRLNKTVSVINSVLKDRKKDIDKTIKNLPVLIGNLSEAAAETREIAASVKNTADKITPGSILSKIPVIIESIRTSFEYVSEFMASRRGKTEDIDEFEEELKKIDEEK